MTSNARAPEPHDHAVHEAFGPDLTAREIIGTQTVGTMGLMVIGVTPMLLTALAREHRFSAAQMGESAMIETFVMGLATAAMGLIARPSRVKLIGALAAFALAGLDLAGLFAASWTLIALRAVAGLVEGVMLWVTVAMIARTATPERWAGVFLTAQTVAQVALVMVLTPLAPHYGANGVLFALAMTAAVTVPFALMCPDRFVPLPTTADGGTRLPVRGWVALAGIVVIVAGPGAVWVYLESIALQAGLSETAAHTAVWVVLALNIVGGLTATMMAGRVRYFTIFTITSIGYLAVWGLYLFHTPTWAFLAASAVQGFIGLLIAPFFVPMTIGADPSRRTAVQGGPAQLVGGALGPLAASWVVTDQDAHGVLWLGAALLLLGMIMVAGLRFTERHASPSIP